MTLDPRRPAVVLGRYALDWGRLVLESGSVAVKLTPKAAAVLALLLDARGATVSRAALFDAVWPGSPSSDEVLTQVVKELRRAFGERAGEDSVITTIPKLGYRWSGPEPRARASGGALAGDLEAVAVARTDSTRASLARSLGVAALGLAIVALVVLGTRTPERSARPPSRELRGATAIVLRPVTVDPGADLDPAIDPDGRRVAYVHRDAHGASLRVRALGESTHRTIALAAGGVPASPAWSPDGRELAYVWHAEGRCELRRIALDGSEPRRVADGCPATVPSSIDWLTDGVLVFSRELPAAAAPAGRQVALHTVAPDGRALAPLSRPTARVATDVHPRGSRDAREIAFVRDGDGANRVVVVDRAGREREVPLPFWPYRVAWSGDALVVAVHGETPRELWRRTGAGALDALTRDGAGPGLAVARDGTTLVFEQHRADDNVWRFGLDAAAAPEPLVHSTRAERMPRLAPDGRALAYIGDETGAVEVHVIALRDGSRRRLSSLAPHVPLDLRWSPGGDRLAVVVGTERGKRLALLARDGSRLATASAFDVEAADFALDGTLYTMVSSDGRRELHRFDADGQRSIAIADFTIASFSVDRVDGALYVARPRAATLERFDLRTQALTDTGAPLVAAPADQWHVDAGRLVQRVEAGDGTSAIVVTDLADGRVLARREWRAPQPFLGRDFELAGAVVHAARRDVEETDLVATELAPGPAPQRTAQASRR
jgi:DNA-binding winged helix-turn-helix (wHTH) protein/Tol biopolymer transport system component